MSWGWGGEGDVGAGICSQHPHHHPFQKSVKRLVNRFETIFQVHQFQSIVSNGPACGFIEIYYQLGNSTAEQQQQGRREGYTQQDKAQTSPSSRSS